MGPILQTRELRVEAPHGYLGAAPLSWWPGVVVALRRETAPEKVAVEAG